MMKHRQLDPILWHAEYAIGVDEIDLQHQRLLFLLNKLNTLIIDGKVARQVAMLALLDDFNEYARHHFRAEEALMTGHLPVDDYLALHLNAHRDYWARIPELTAHYKAGDTAAAVELVHYLNDWWRHHILGTDQALGRALNLRGVH
jgi:hemerythrin-like metal-binding protein